jgi:hypothetical protein
MNILISFIIIHIILYTATTFIRGTTDPDGNKLVQLISMPRSIHVYNPTHDADDDVDDPHYSRTNYIYVVWI